MPFRIKSTLFKISGSGFILILLSLSMAQAASISVNSGMSFGLIEFASSSHQGQLVLGSNGGMTMTGTGLSYLGGATAAQITLIGDNGIVELRCSATSVLGGREGGTLEITDIEASIGAGVSAGAGTPCAGIATSGANPIILDLGATPNPRIYFGGTLNIPYDSIDGSQQYESDNGGGADLSVSTIFQ